MTENETNILQAIGERPISKSEYQDLIILENLCTHWFDFEELEEVYYLSPEVLEAISRNQNKGSEPLGLGEVEERIVEILEEGKNIKWGKLALSMWVFFLFIVIYTIMKTVVT